MRARQNLCDVPILFLAVDDDDEFRWQVQRAGADWFGLRPLGMLELQRQVSRLIRHGRPKSQRLPRPPTPIRRLGRAG
jgi:DNA-binding response OmpR family regulator